MTQRLHLAAPTAAEASNAVAAIRVIVADDHAGVRRNLRRLLRPAPSGADRNRVDPPFRHQLRQLAERRLGTHADDTLMHRVVDANIAEAG